MLKKINNYFSDITNTLNLIDKAIVQKVVTSILRTYEARGTIFTFGNGGSGATASHFCGDLIKGASMGLSKKFKAICLNDNVPALLAIANDSSYDHIFSHQIENFLTPQDLVISFSGSGNSPNIINALEFAKTVPAQTIAFCGFNGGKAKTIADIALHVPINDMEISEDLHMILAHCIKQIIIESINSRIAEPRLSIVPPVI